MQTLPLKDMLNRKVPIPIELLRIPLKHRTLLGNNNRRSDIADMVATEITDAKDQSSITTSGWKERISFKTNPIGSHYTALSIATIFNMTPCVRNKRKSQ
ncbi:MAG: hypothetical protein HYU39_04555 [Thaumarchaeota archaeon]|nr:hypothetical protein [Nitrososphaerota archaeon]